MRTLRNDSGAAPNSFGDLVNVTGNKVGPIFDYLVLSSDTRCDDGPPYPSPHRFSRRTSLQRPPPRKFLQLDQRDTDRALQSPACLREPRTLKFHASHRIRAHLHPSRPRPTATGAGPGCSRSVAKFGPVSARQHLRRRNAPTSVRREFESITQVGVRPGPPMYRTFAITGPQIEVARDDFHNVSHPMASEVIGSP